MHQVDDGQYGFVEALSQQLKIPLYIVHRLDKQTSGVVIIAKSKDSAANLSELFEKKLVKKTYYFLTDVHNLQTAFTVKTHIEKKQNHFVNVEGVPPNSETEFEYVKQVGPNYLWKAFPLSGKSHQIRLHATFSRIPILGDTEHQGKKWFRLALHAQQLQFLKDAKKIAIQAELPPSFSLLENNETALLFHDSFFNKKQLFSFEKDECYRLIDNESSLLKCDVLGSKIWVYDYSLTGLPVEDLAKLEAFAAKENKSLLVRHMLDRGQGVGGLEKATLKSAESEAAWTAKEELTSYNFRTDSGFSAGLFLDQRENRRWLSQYAQNKMVLNLFCYTAGFSVCAAQSKALQVTSVDVSKKFLEWSKENFKLNGLSSEQHEFFAQDVLLFLNGSIKRNRKWDLIVCDPPSFGRSKDSVWKIEKNIGELADLLWQCLQPNGKILFTSNYEGWSRSELIKKFTQKLPAGKFNMSRMPLLSLDYGETDDIHSSLKGFILTKSPAKT